MEIYQKKKQIFTKKCLIQNNRIDADGIDSHFTKEITISIVDYYYYIKMILYYKN